MRELTREQVWHLVQGAHSPQQIAEAKRVSGKWIREHPEDERFLQEAMTSLGARRRALEETYE
jgi:hypothetical protein